MKRGQRLLPAAAAAALVTWILVGPGAPLCGTAHAGWLPGWATGWVPDGPEREYDPTFASPVDTLPGHQGTYLYYHGLDYGSQTLIHPLRMIINGGYGILQIENRDNKPFEIDYEQGFRNVTENLLHPDVALSKYGYWDFFQREVIPVSVNSGQAQYWPNYMNHTLGGGMSYRMMIEWYRYRNFPKPKLTAGATMFVYHLLNEVVENDDDDGPATDAIADFWIFNPAGVWLFSSDRVAGFFSHKLHMTDWSFQPAYFPDGQELWNNGQNYAVKWHLNDSGSKSLFYHWGSQAEVGMSFTRPSGRCVSVGLGLKAKSLVQVDEYTKGLSVAASGGIFYDRHNSLLASLVFAHSKDHAYRLNLYPGLIRMGPLKPGFFVALDQEGHTMGGITFGSLQHLPFGLGMRF